MNGENERRRGQQVGRMREGRGGEEGEENRGGRERERKRERVHKEKGKGTREGEGSEWVEEGCESGRWEGKRSEW